MPDGDSSDPFPTECTFPAVQYRAHSQVVVVVKLPKHAVIVGGFMVTYKKTIPNTHLLYNQQDFAVLSKILENLTKYVPDPNTVFNDLEASSKSKPDLDFETLYNQKQSVSGALKKKVIPAAQKTMFVTGDKIISQTGVQPRTVFVQAATASAPAVQTGTWTALQVGGGLPQAATVRTLPIPGVPSAGSAGSVQPMAVFAQPNKSGTVTLFTQKPTVQGQSSQMLYPLSVLGVPQVASSTARSVATPTSSKSLLQQPGFRKILKASNTGKKTLKRMTIKKTVKKHKLEEKCKELTIPLKQVKVENLTGVSLIQCPVPSGKEPTRDDWMKVEPDSDDVGMETMTEDDLAMQDDSNDEDYIPEGEEMSGKPILTKLLTGDQETDTTADAEEHNYSSQRPGKKIFIIKTVQNIQGSYTEMGNPGKVLDLNKLFQCPEIEHFGMLVWNDF